MDKIKVLLVDDDLEWQGAMGRYINKKEDIIIVGMVKTKTEAIDFISSIDTDIVLMDINLTDNKLDGIDAAIEITNISNAKIVMLTSMKGEDIILDSFTAGAVNFVSKEDYRIIPQMIRTLYSKTTPQEILVKEYNKLKKEEQIKELSPCEKEIYRLMEDGVSRYQMQVRLNKSENTIKKFIRQILRKLDVKTSKDAVQKVNRKGLANKS